MSVEVTRTEAAQPPARVLVAVQVLVSEAEARRLVDEAMLTSEGTMGAAVRERLGMQGVPVGYRQEHVVMDAEQWVRRRLAAQHQVAEDWSAERVRGVSSYEHDAPLPVVGTRWVWEPDLPHARELVEVLDVTWNGEEWWVRVKGSGGLAYPPSPNDLARFWEAVVPPDGAGRQAIERRTARVGEPA